MHICRDVLLVLDDTSETVIEDPDTAVSLSLVVVKEGLIDMLDFFSITLRQSVMKPDALFIHYFYIQIATRMCMHYCYSTYYCLYQEFIIPYSGKVWRG